MTKHFKIYLAGVLDCDGCFTLSLTYNKKRRQAGVCISPQVRIGQRGNSDWFLKQLQKETKLGRIYYSNKGEPNEVCSWQTTNTADAITLTEAVLPYLRLKKKKAKKFLNVVKYYQSTANPRGFARVLAKGRRLRKRKEMYKIIKVAVNLNYDRQTERYRDYHGWEHWKPIIDKLYPD